MLVINNIVSWKGNEQSVERILWIGIQEDAAFVINIKVNKTPYCRKLSDIKNSIEAGEAIILDNDPYIKIYTEELITKKAKEMRDKAWAIIKDMVEKEPKIFMSSERNKLIREASKNYNVSGKTVLNYLKKYWIRGKTINSLLPDTNLCGGGGAERKAGNVKRGRKRRNRDIVGDGININDDIKKIFKTSINKFYNTAAKNSLTVAYQLMLKEYFSNDFKVENDIRMPVLKPQNELPTFSQFKYWFEKDRNFKRETILRKSTKKYEQQNRAIMGNSTTEALGPGSIYQIDATIGDVYLVSRFNRQWIIGRPVIYFVMDVFSRIIAGMYVGLEGPSWAGAMMALANAAADKVEFCKEYGIEIGEGDWPVHYIPETIIADRGEFEGSNVDNLIEALNVKVQNTPPFRADWKGIIEQNFKVINGRVKPFLPGVINTDLRERGERDYRLDAKLSLYDFTKIIIKCALYHNKSHYLQYYNRQEMMIEDDVKCIPIQLWNWGISNRSGKLRYINPDIVKLNLMPSDTATVTGRGIRYKNMYYSSKVCMQEKWFEKARNKGSWKIEISYDSRNMNYIYIKNTSGRNYEKCYLLEYQSSYRDKCIEEIIYLQEKEKNDIKAETNLHLQSKIDLISEIESIVEKAAKCNTDDSKLSNSKKIKGIRENRRIEKMLNREVETFELGRDKVVDTSRVIEIKAEDKSGNIILSDIELLKRKQKEAMKDIHE